MAAAALAGATTARVEACALLRRRSAFYWAAAVCILRAKYTFWRAERLDAEYGAAMWQLTQRANAELLYRTILRLRGYLLKVTCAQ